MEETPEAHKEPDPEGQVGSTDGGQALPVRSHKRIMVLIVGLAVLLFLGQKLSSRSLAGEQQSPTTSVEKGAKTATSPLVTELERPQTTLVGPGPTSPSTAQQQASGQVAVKAPEPADKGAERPANLDTTGEAGIGSIVEQKPANGPDVTKTSGTVSGPPEAGAKPTNSVYMGFDYDSFLTSSPWRETIAASSRRTAYLFLAIFGVVVALILFTKSDLYIDWVMNRTFQYRHALTPTLKVGALLSAAYADFRFVLCLFPVGFLCGLLWALFVGLFPRSAEQEDGSALQRVKKATSEYLANLRFNPSDTIARLLWIGSGLTLFLFFSLEPMEYFQTGPEALALLHLVMVLLQSSMLGVAAGGVSFFVSRADKLLMSRWNIVGDARDFVSTKFPHLVALLTAFFILTALELIAKQPISEVASSLGPLLELVASYHLSPWIHNARLILECLCSAACVVFVTYYLDLS